MPPAVGGNRGVLKEDRMKTATLVVGMLAALAANVAAQEPGFSVTVTASGLN